MAVGRYAQVHQATGFVVNVILWDPIDQPSVQPPDGYDFIEDVEGKAGPGFSYDGTTFNPPPAPTSPESAPAA